MVQVLSVQAAYRCAAIAALVIVLTITAFAQDRSAQDRRQNEAGKFDFYVLALSWSQSGPHPAAAMHGTAVFLCRARAVAAA